MLASRPRGGRGTRRRQGLSRFTCSVNGPAVPLTPSTTMAYVPAGSWLTVSEPVPGCEAEPQATSLEAEASPQVRRR